MNTPKLPPLPQLFRDAMDWGRSYGTRLNNTPEMLDEVASQFADKATAAIAAQGVPDGWTEDQIAQAAMEAEIPDAKLESLLIALASAPPAPQADKAHSLSSAVKTVISAMNEDPDYSWTWHCNVAMAFVDAGGDAYTANQGAARFMRLLAGVEPAYDLPAPQDHGREMGADNCERAIRAMKEQT